MQREDYEAQVALIVRALPFVATEKIFALKGGTPINLFYIDTTYFIDGNVVSLFLFLALRNTQFINTGVAASGLNWDFAHSYKIILPPEQILEIFHKFVSPISQQIGVLSEHSIKLAKARDLLLLRLVN